MCRVYKHISLGLKIKNADCASILTDIDLVILGINSESMFISIIPANQFHRSAKQVPIDRRCRWWTKGEAPLACHGRSAFTNSCGWFSLIGLRLCFTVPQGHALPLIWLVPPIRFNFRCFARYTFDHHKTFVCFCREVKAMMNSQKSTVEKKDPLMRNYSRSFFF